jgi:hypothetical protein
MRVADRGCVSNLLGARDKYDNLRNDICMTSEIQSFYRALELQPGASLEQVKQARRELAKVWHPDRFPNDPKLQRKAQERLKDINNAYEILHEFLTSGAPPSRSRPASSQSSDTSREDGQQRQETERERPKPPSKPDEEMPSAPARENAGGIKSLVRFWVCFLLCLAGLGIVSGLMLVGLFLLMGYRII